MPGTTRATRPRRDAQRNRALLVATAREAFSREGLGASMDAIAKTAGVGAGTLYRHFPTKDDLVAAVIDADEPRLEAERDRIMDADVAPTEALEQWLAVLVLKMTAYEGLPGPLRAAVDATSTPLGSTCQALIDATATFLARARAAGATRPGLSARPLFLAALGIAWAGTATGDDPEIRNQLTDILRAGWSADPGPRPRPRREAAEPEGPRDC